MQLSDLGEFFSEDTIQLSDLRLYIPMLIIENIVCFNDAGIDLEERIGPELRIDKRLEDICGFRF